MNLLSKLSLASLVTVGTLTIGLVSYNLTYFKLLNGSSQEIERRSHQITEKKYFDVDKWMFDIIQKSQDDLLINPIWYFQYARDKTRVLSI